MDMNRLIIEVTVLYFICNIALLAILPPMTVRGTLRCLLFGVFIVAVHMSEEEDDGSDS